ncbi:MULTISPECIES: alpha/beta fold hydrolase [unclassified Pseudoalteromonas]|uniref:thioesterase II family protein n=1 Tax=unclassified Pseudoalteromonas TaxID=194690 RepID=UPI002097CC33|nr:alpha/beta fold hydrolase [Pseudoalteromonas sp. XMcav2-N]MCO7188409.1 thioesterase domain-containing protein [Pseudoalteromonas sp. XMcav2-N]
MKISSEKIFAFPGMGSFGTEFAHLLKEFRPNIKVVRYSQSCECTTDGEALLKQYLSFCIEQITAAGCTQVILLGHSFGAYLAYQCAVILGQSNITVKQLIVVGANSPLACKVPAPLPTCDSEVEAYFNALDPQLLSKIQDEEWKQLMIERTKYDFLVLQEFYQQTHKHVECPIIAWMSKADSLTDAEGTQDWGKYTVEEFSLYVVDGGHFDLPAHPEIRRCIEKIVTTSSDENEKLMVSKIS